MVLHWSNAVCDFFNASNGSGESPNKHLTFKMRLGIQSCVCTAFIVYVPVAHKHD